MTARQLKQAYFRFFTQKGHKSIPSASLVPENDPSVLFTTAGMHPLVPFLMGESHPEGKRIVNVQKCIRTGDIDEVGDPTHLTFFEMLGNWSLGDYWKSEAIEWSFEFLTKELGVELERLAVSVFAGDGDAPRDEESAAKWKELGISEDRIAFLGKDDNWWPAGGKQAGPQGPDTEMFYWIEDSEPPTKFDPEDSRWVEIWNDVFMEFERKADGSLIPLKQKNVDTGMGVERTVAALDGKTSVYEIDSIEPIVQKIRQHATQKEGNERSIYIITDHIRAIVFLLADERQVRPSNVDQGYVLRRLIRRMIRHAKIIGFDVALLEDLAQVVIHEHHVEYPELSEHRDAIMEELGKERDKFLKTLEQGIKMFEKFSQNGTVSGEEAFTLFASYGFPLEMVQELAHEKNIVVDTEEFEKHLQDHQKKSRTASAGKFKGGLADHSEETIKYHTANHLMLEAMKRILGRDEVNQKGSNITAERLRFDFTYPRKLTDEEKQQIEEMVNEQIDRNLEVTTQEMSVDEAKALGATGVFDHKYGDTVKVYSIGDFSKEICGGPHVITTKDMGHLKIKKEQASSAGVRRIKAVLE